MPKGKLIKTKAGCIFRERPKDKRKTGKKKEESAMAFDLFPFNMKPKANLNRYLKISNTEISNSNGRNTSSLVIDFKIRNLKKSAFPIGILEMIISKLCSKILQMRAKKPRLIGMQILNKYMTTPFFVPLRSPKLNTPQTILDALLQLNRQSGKRLKLLKTKMKAKITGYWGRKTEKGKKPKKKKHFWGGCSAPIARPGLKSLIPIENMDGLCLLRSIAILISKIEGGPKQFRAMKTNTFRVQDRAVSKLLLSTKLSQTGNYGINEIEKIQNYLNQHYPKRYRLVIFDWHSRGSILFKGQLAIHQLNILYFDHHYEPLLKPEQIYQKQGKFCVDCQNMAYPNFHSRNCPVCCNMCYRYGLGFPCKKTREMKCKDCQFTFPNDNCFNFHRKRGMANGKPICQQRHYCKECGDVVYERAKKHICTNKDAGNSNEENKQCEKCAAFHSLGQTKCYIQPFSFLRENNINQHMAQRNIRYIFYDSETCQKKKIELANGKMAFKHEVNLLVCEIWCKKCLDETEGGNCCCGIFGEKFKFKNNILPDNPHMLAFHNFEQKKICPISNFLDFLTNHGPPSTVTYLLAHNSGKFDFHLVLEKLYEMAYNPDMIMTGLKIYSATVRGHNRRTLIFKDSLNYLSGALSGFYDTFGLQDCADIAKKPFFPHHFNRHSNLDKELATLPPAKYYGPKDMKKAVLKEFNAWYSANKMTNFCLKNELISYCANDVKLLREACARFRRIILQICPEVEPFERTNTNAKLAITIWREMFLEANMIINLEGCLNIRQQQSIMALKFFRLLSAITGKTIRTAEWSIGEFPVPETGYRIDGFIGNKTGIEFLGCFYHGHKECYPNMFTELAGGKMAHELYAATKERIAKIEKKGINVYTIWECQFKAMLKRNKKLREEYEKIYIAPPLDARRDGLRGGRVEPFRLITVAKDDEIIEHYDIISLYPSVMKTEKYPVGEPIVLTRENIHMEDLLDYQGLLLVRVLPPRNLRLAFLPYRTKKGSLTFPLCAKCADQQQQKCTHSQMERTWVAAFIHTDIKLALDLGYKILEIFEVWHWPDEAWSTNVFSGYINAFLKIKTESSGWPSHIVSDEQKREYVEAYLVREMLELDPDNMVKNSGWRHISKDLLNSLWGKLCQRSRPTMIKITKSADEFHELMEDPELEIIDIFHINKKLDRVVYRKKEEFCIPPETNAVHIAVFVTAYARQRLYHRLNECLENGHDLCYADTDSAITKRKKWQEPLKTGQFLGDMMPELPPGNQIYAIICAGPKNYIYIYGPDKNHLKLVIKIRGFQMNYSARSKLTFRRILKMVLSKFGNQERERTSRIHYTSFTRNKLGHVYTQKIRKNYRVVYEKGVVQDDFTCMPFGYCADVEEVQSSEEEDIQQVTSEEDE